MTTGSAPVRKILEGYTTVTPWIISRDTAQLLGFMTRAFAAEEITRFHNEDGSIGHAEARSGDAVVMAFDAKPEWPDTPAFLRLYVEDCEAVYRQALVAGATSVTEPTTLSFGDQVARVRDPLGNVWWVQERLEDMDPEEMGRRSQQPEYVEAMRYVQGAQIVLPRDGG